MCVEQTSIMNVSRNTSIRSYDFMENGEDSYLHIVF
jgi:hypothetical protein